MNLKTLQRFRYTIPVIGVLFLIALGVGFISLTTNLTKPKETPLQPKYIAGESKSKDILRPDWSKIRLGISSAEIEQIMGKPNRTDQLDGKTTYIYTPNPLTPLATHEITFKDNQVTRIKRGIDSYYDTAPNLQYIQKYGNPIIIREQKGIDTYSLQAFKISENEYVVTEVDRQNNSVYNIYDMTNSSYNEFVQEIKTPVPGNEHEDFEVEPI